MAASAPAFRPLVKAAGPQPASGRPVLLLGVLGQDRDGRAADLRHDYTAPARLPAVEHESDYDGCMVRPGSWSRPAGESPVRVDTGVPGSRPRFVVERRRAERGVKSLCGGSKRAGRSVSESCSLVISTVGEPSRSCRGEGHAWQALFRGQPAGSFRGRGSGTCAWSGLEQERPVCPAFVG